MDWRPARHTTPRRAEQELVSGRICCGGDYAFILFERGLAGPLVHPSRARSRRLVMADASSPTGQVSFTAVSMILSRSPHRMGKYDPRGILDRSNSGSFKVSGASMTARACSGGPDQPTARAIRRKSEPIV